MSCFWGKWLMHIHDETHLCIQRVEKHTSRQTHAHVRRQRLAVLDLQPRTITCDLAPLKLVTNSILGQLIRHAWALGFFYVVIKARVYGRPQALGWMIVLTSSEPKATHSWGGMRCVQAAELPQKQPLIHRGGWLRCTGKWFLLLLLFLCLTPRNRTHITHAHTHIKTQTFYPHVLPSSFDHKFSKLNACIDFRTLSIKSRKYFSLKL